MVKDEAHFILPAIDTTDSSAERSNQIIHRFEQHIGQHRPFQVSSQPFDKGLSARRGIEF